MFYIITQNKKIANLIQSYATENDKHILSSDCFKAKMTKEENSKNYIFEIDNNSYMWVIDYLQEDFQASFELEGLDHVLRV